MLRALFGSGPKVDIAGSLEAGATVLDVRTPAEFSGGHVRGSINIPLDKLAANLHRIPKDKPVIACCQSGMRSGQAIKTLTEHGFTAHNGGSWRNVERHLAG